MANPFGEPISLEELARQQGVSPADDLDKIAALWSVDDDHEELLRFILSERAARRKRTRKIALT
jgi:hypothetical protein